MRYILAMILAAAALLSARAADDQTSDSDFIKDSYVSNLKEHAVAGLAASKSSDPRVKTFASTLSKDHLKANEDLKHIAESMAVKIPDYSDDNQSYDMLSKLSGDNFDRAFVNWTLETHIRGVALLDAQAKTSGGELKAFIDRQQPIEKSHLDNARTLSDSFKNAIRDVPVHDNQAPIDVRYDPPENPLKYDLPNLPQKTGDQIKDAGDKASRMMNDAGTQPQDMTIPKHDKSFDFVR